jgi:chromate transporter
VGDLIQTSQPGSPPGPPGGVVTPPPPPVPTPPVDDEDPPIPAVTLWELVVAFTQMSSLSFGGGLTAWARTVLVERRKWLSEEQFLRSLAIVQVLPGPNTIKLAVYVGAHLRGPLGAFASVIGLIAMPMVLVLVLGVIYFHSGKIVWLENILQGLGVCAAGMAFSLALKLFVKHLRDPLFVNFGIISFVLIAFVRMKMLPTVVCLGVISIIMYRNRGPAAPRTPPPPRPPMPGP